MYIFKEILDNVYLDNRQLFWLFLVCYTLFATMADKKTTDFSKARAKFSIKENVAHGVEEGFQSRSKKGAGQAGETRGGEGDPRGRESAPE